MDRTAQSGPPYAPKTVGAGGFPTVIPDIPILAVLLALYAGAAVGHMYIFQKNKARGHKFIMSGLLFGFSMARIMTCTLRMVWATHRSNISVAIASQIFTNLGIILIFIVNNIFALRIFRARHRTLGWHSIVRVLMRLAYALTLVSVILLLIFVPWSFYTLDESFKSSIRDIQLAVLTWLLVFTCIPLVLIGLAYALPVTSSIDHFGKRSLTHKTCIVLASVTLCLVEYIFRVGSMWATPRPVGHPAWFDSKACFYCFIFVPEICITYMFLAVRVDQVFHVPNGSSKRNTYQVMDEDFEVGRKERRERHADETSVEENKEKESSVGIQR